MIKLYYCLNILKLNLYYVIDFVDIEIYKCHFYLCLSVYFSQYKSLHSLRFTLMNCLICCNFIIICSSEFVNSFLNISISIFLHLISISFCSSFISFHSILLSLSGAAVSTVYDEAMEKYVGIGERENHNCWSAVLCCTVLCCAMLCHAIMCCATLCSALMDTDCQ